MRLDENPATRIAWKISDIYRLHLQNIKGVNERCGLYPGQTRILHFIAEYNGSTQNELADLLGVTPPSIAVSIKRMQKAGLVEKAADDADMRINRIYVTEKGKKIHIESMSDFMMCDDRLLKGFTPEEIERLGEYLTRIEANLKDAGNPDD